MNGGFLTLKKPIDFRLSPESISILSCPSLEPDFKFIIDGVEYFCQRSLARTVFSRINEIINSNNNIHEFSIPIHDPNSYFQYVQSMLAGEVITISEKNAMFLNKIAILLGCNELEMASNPFLKRYDNENLIPPTLFELLSSVGVSFLEVFGRLMRFILFFCEMIGFAVSFAFVFNLFMVPITSGFISSTIPVFFKIFLMIPLFFYTFFVVNPFSLVVYNLWHHNFLTSNTLYPKHITLLKLIYHVFPFFNHDPEPDFFSLDNTKLSIKPIKKIDYRETTKEKMNIILGICFLVIISAMFIKGVFPFIISLLVVKLPVYMVCLLIVLYAIHSFLSSFQRSRENFINHSDFSDPFLCSMYFFENEWYSAIKALFSNTQGSGLSFLKAIFSKTTLTFYLEGSMCTLLLFDSKSFNGIQKTLIIIVYMIILFPLINSINFGIIVLGRLSSNPCSENQLEKLRQWMHSDAQRKVFLERKLLWSGNCMPIRASRIFFVVFSIVIISLAMYPSILAPPENNYIPSPNVSIRYENSISIQNPLCMIGFKEISVLQFAALSSAVYFTDPNDKAHEYLLQEFFGSKSKQIVIVNDIVYPSYYSGFIRHYKISGLDIIAIRGTDNSFDILADVELWASSFIMNILQSSVPIFSIYAMEAREFLGYAMHLPRFMFKNYSLINGYISFISEYVLSVPQSIIIGHSLGGGLAKLIAAITGRQAISFSGPGVQALASFYIWKDTNIAHSYINVVPRLDPVASVDAATGSDFLIPCNEGIFQCHSITRTICMISTLCGNYQKHKDFCMTNLETDDAGMKKIWDSGHPFTNT